MPQEAEEGKRFARDMRRIREAHNLTVDDLHEETKIPIGLIQAFEETGLFDHPQFNRVYLRSFVRTYANVVGVDADAALAALEDALGGRYEGSLAADYLDEEPETAAADEATGRPAEDEGDDSRTQREEEGAALASKEDASDEPSRAPKTSERDDQDREPPLVSTRAQSAASYDEPAPEEEEVDEDWAAQSPPGRHSDSASGVTATTGVSAAAGASAAGDRPGARRTGAAHTGSRRSTGGDASSSGGADRRWLIAGGMIIIVAVVVWVLVIMLGGESEQQTAESVAAADTAQTEDPTAAQEPAGEPINIPAIGDTMNVHIIADQGPVDPIRVTVDDDLRRPYWIDQGDSMAFNPTNRIVVEELLDNINLKVEGIEYPTNRRDGQGRIVITRDSLENYFASLQDQPELLRQLQNQQQDQEQAQQQEQP